MATSNSAFWRWTSVLLLVALVTLVVIVGTTIWLVGRTQTYFDAVLEAREARSAVVDLRDALQGAETGQRGYLLTLDENYLEPYRAAMARIPEAEAYLVEMLERYPQAADAVVSLQQAIAAKLEELTETVRLAEAGQVGDALAIVRTDSGRERMEQAQAILAAILAAADQQISSSVEEQRSSARALQIVVIGGGLIIILVGGASAFVVRRYTREIIAARQTVEGSNQQLEERVAERTSELARANEEVQRFAYIVTHDLRAPLVNIMGFTSELETALGPIQAFVDKVPPTDDPEDAEARQVAQQDLPEAIGFIRAATRKMDGLINAILKISREGRRAPKPEPINLAELLGNTASAIQHQVAEQGGSISIDGSIPAVVSDRLSLEQVFGNLLDNAVKYAAPGKPVEVSVTGGSAEGNRVFVEFSDNGRGIAPQDHERVFELFRRSGEQSKPGEGIGLAHVRTLIRNLGGDVTMRSELGKGTTFRVTLARDLRPIVGSAAR